ncbi:hypothetical protein KC725_04160, partial [Candidatus Peregrinibacteria bacterium]|nr:hypothetical protein [Candidatus Peregrinibacteria bacterium]
MAQHQPTPLENIAESPQNMVADQIIQILQRRYPTSLEQQVEAIEQALSFSHDSSARIEERREQPPKIFSETFQIINELKYPYKLFVPALEAALGKLRTHTVSFTRGKIEIDEHDPLNDLRTSLASEFETTISDTEAPPTIREPQAVTQTMPSLGVPPVESAPPTPSKFVRLSENVTLATNLAASLATELLGDLMNDGNSLTLEHALTMESAEVETHLREQIYEAKPGVDEQEVSTILYLVTIKCKSYINITLRQAEAFSQDMENLLINASRSQRKKILRAARMKSSTEAFIEELEKISDDWDELKEITLKKDNSKIFSPVGQMEELDWKIRDYIVWHAISKLKDKPSILTAFPIKGIGLMRPNYQPEPESKRQPRSTPPPRRKRLKET